MYNLRINILLILYLLFQNLLILSVGNEIFDVNDTTDTVIFKCYGVLKNGQSHKKYYVYNDNVEKKVVYQRFGEEDEIWFVYNHKNTSLLNGTIACDDVVDSNSNDNTWTSQLRWNSPPETLKNAVPLYGYQEIKDSCQKSNESKTVEVYIDIDGILQVGTPSENEIYKNQLRYLFLLNDNNDKTNILQPCIIYKSTFDTPNIFIFDQNDTIIKSNDSTIHFITKPQILQSYQVILQTPNSTLPYFYLSENIYINNVNYTYNETYIENNENETINGGIDVNGYGIFKLTYICNECGIDNKNATTSKVYFFGPKENNEIVKSEVHLYMSKTLSMKPNCSLNEYSYAYLEKVSFDNHTIDIKYLKTHLKYKNFKLKNDLIIYQKEKEPNGTLTCYYKTPVNYINDIYTFIVVYPPDQIMINNDSDYVIIRNRKTFNKINEINNDKGLPEGFNLQKSSYGILIIILLIICLFLTSAIIYVNREEIKNSYNVARLNKKYPNIYKWCDNLNNENWENYCKIITSNLYIPEKMLEVNDDTIIEEGEKVENNIESLFVNTLAHSQKDLSIKIQAHYINIKNTDRLYIISDHPTPQLIPNFWEMIYYEDVSVVVSFAYRCPGDNTTTWQNFWPHCDISYDNLKIFKEDGVIENIKYVSEYVYYVGLDNLPINKVTIFHVERWKEHVMPGTTYGLVELYKLVSTTAGKKRVLIDTQYGVDSSTFIYTYFACIIEVMLKDKSTNNPMEVIKEIRKCRYGGDIGAVEYGFILKAIVDYFVSENIIFDLERYNKFSINYNEYTRNINLRVSNVTSNLRTFLSFLNILDKGLVKQMSLGIKTVGRLDIKSLKNNCSRWYEIENDRVLREKNRYHDIPCLDKYALYSGEWPLYNNDISTYINANELSYTVTKELKRSLIMCQAPTKSTVNGVVDVMFRNNVGVLVLIAKTSERHEKWMECFPIENDQLVFGKYTVVKLKIPKKIEPNIQMSEYYITDGSTSMPFNVLQLTDWSSTGDPINAWEFLSLYRHTIKLADDRTILIQCSNGVGWTGAFALIIYTIDKIGANYYFDPLKDLATLREHRNQAVQNEEQLMIALTVIRDYYIEHINDNKFNIYRWYSKYYKSYFKRNENAPSLSWGNELIDPLANAGYYYEFEEHFGI